MSEEKLNLQDVLVESGRKYHLLPQLKGYLINEGWTEEEIKSELERLQNENYIYYMSKDDTFLVVEDKMPNFVYKPTSVCGLGEPDFEENAQLINEITLTIMPEIDKMRFYTKWDTDHWDLCLPHKEKIAKELHKNNIKISDICKVLECDNLAANLLICRGRKYTS